MARQKDDQLAALFAEYMIMDIEPEEMANHFRTEFKRNPNLMSSTAESTTAIEKKRGSARKQSTEKDKEEKKYSVSTPASSS